jgi:hypothetical protein
LATSWPAFESATYEINPFKPFPWPVAKPVMVACWFMLEVSWTVRMASFHVSGRQ